MLSSRIFKRSFSSSFVQHGSKVAVLGAAGGIGQPLSLLLKLNPLIEKLSLYDIVNTPGVAADLSHINSPATVTGYKDSLPKAHILVISNPVNSTVPIVAEVLKKHGVFDPARLLVLPRSMLCVPLHCVLRQGHESNDVNVHVVGGHSGVTILPLLSQTGLKFTQEEIEKLTLRIQYGGDEVVKAKDGAGSATLSMAQAGARFTNSLLKALNGQKGIIEPTFVYSPVAKKEGADSLLPMSSLVPKVLPRSTHLGPMSAYEKTLFAAVVPELQKNIAKGVEFVNKA
ncbi:hypothetical protein BASA81_005199 [Batrachochytrium salamandrivorans]|nr:hypothetical protein BASA81_005199 [Batrachochytrium salamandrivorans]